MKVRKPPDHWSKKTLKKQAKRHFNRMIRAAAADDCGLIVCVTCGKVMPWSAKGSHAGHWSPGDSVAFVELNCHPQCYRCNDRLSGNLQAYDAYMRDTYGQHVMDWIKSLRHVERRYSDAELKLIIAACKLRAAHHIQAKGLL